MIDVTDFEHNGREFRMRIVEDEYYSPSEWTTESESPALFAAWRYGTMQYVTVEVTLLLDGAEVEETTAAVSGVEYGQCDAWPTSIRTDDIVRDYGPDLATESLDMASNLK